MLELKGLPQPPDHPTMRRKKFGPRHNKKLAGLGPAGPKFGPRRPRAKKAAFSGKKWGHFGTAGKGRLAPKRFGPVFRSKLAGVGPKFGPVRQRSLRSPKTKKPRGSTRKARQSTARQSTARGGFRRQKQSWLVKMAMRAIKRAVQSTKPRDFRNHGYKGITKRGRTGLGGR